MASPALQTKTVKYKVVSMPRKQEKQKKKKKIRHQKIKPSLPPILQNLHAPTVMPFRKLGTALPAGMLNILQRGHQVRDAAETATEAKNSSPATIQSKNVSPSIIRNHSILKTTQKKTYCVVPPLTGVMLVNSRPPQTGQSTGVGADCTPCKGTAVAYPLG